MVSHRSTKGASKARRDHINHEIRNMRALLPIGWDEQERLSYLHSMSAICTYIRKSVLFQGLPAVDGSPCSLPYEAFLQALHGFILVTSAQGRLVYLSENVVEYLGVSMIDLLQSDSLLDLVEPSDVPVVQSNLDVHNNSSTDRSFVCSMQTSKACKHKGGSCSVLVRGGFLSLPDLELSWSSSSSSSSSGPARPPLFVALCTPTLNRLSSADLGFCHSFGSVHGLDMTFAELSDSVVFHLGYSAEELSGASWYGLVHPDDLSPCAESHRRLLETEEDLQVEMVLRLQCSDLSWVWIYTRADRKSECRSISCTNCIISDTEARFLQTRIGSAAFGPSSPRTPAAALSGSSSSSSSKSKCFKRQRASDSQSEEEEPVAVSRARRDSPAPLGDSSSPSLFTPPLSPASSYSSSSSSPLQQEQELSRDLLLMNAHAFTGQLLPSPEASPSYYSYPEAALTCHPAPPSLAEHAFHPAVLAALPSPSAPTHYDFHQPCPSDAPLVPGGLPVSDVCESSLELHQDDFGLLEQPAGGSLAQHVPPHHHHPHHVVHPSYLTPHHSPTSTQSHQYDEREQAEISILAQQISSLARSFDMYHTQAARGPLPSDSEWPSHPSPPCDLFLDEGVIDSILKDLDAKKQEHAAVPYGHQQGAACSRAGSRTGEGPVLGSGDPFSMGHQNSGLHQLNSFTVCRVESLQVLHS